MSGAISAEPDILSGTIQKVIFRPGFLPKMNFVWGDFFHAGDKSPLYETLQACKSDLICSAMIIRLSLSALLVI
jgi:hypothetical protein